MSDPGALVYVVDDDASVREGVARLIRSAGLIVKTFASAEEFLAAPREHKRSCLVLDVNLPGLNGLDLQQKLTKSDVEVPIIFLTGHGDIPMTVRAVRAGAANFLTKPFDDEELLNAIWQCIGSCEEERCCCLGPEHGGSIVTAQQRKRASTMSAAAHPRTVNPRMPEFPPFRLDNVNQCLWRHRDSGQDECIRLTPKPFAILCYLIEHAGRLVTQDELLDAVWPNTFVQPEVLKTHILDVRNALGDSAKDPRFIETLPRRGYQFIAPVKSASATSEPACGLPSHKLVGRGAELTQLQSCLWRAMGGQRQIVFITGEAGIGKTLLVDEFLRRAATDVPEIHIARGSTIEGYGGKEAYYPVLEALSHICRVFGGDAIARTLCAHAPTWLVQFPALVTAEQRQSLQREILGDTRERMLREICEALETISSDTPLLLVLEDLHWADTSTIDLISALARRRASANLMLICAYRTPDAALAQNPLRAVKQELLVQQLCREILLEPLTEADVANYLANETDGAAVPPGLTTLVYRHSEGNPLFMVAALEHMRDRGLIALEKGNWKIKAALEKIHLEPPERLREMIELQIEKLSAKEQEVLELASGKGKSFTAHDSAIGKSINQEEFEKTCEALSRRQHMVRRRAPRKFPDGSSRPCYEFIHSLYRDVFYYRQSLGQRPMLTIAASSPGRGSS